MKTLMVSALFLGILVSTPTRAGEAGGGPTCGQMISTMSVVPAKLSEGAESVAEMLEAHAAFMSQNNDKDSKAEVKGLTSLAKAHHKIATELKQVVAEMNKAASWPGAPHDMQKMSKDPKLAAAQKKVIAVHKELIAILQKMVADMEAQSK